MVLDVRRGENFHVTDIGPFADLQQHEFKHPASPKPAKGKVFLKEPLGMSGIEMSVNVFPPGWAMPFTHAHKENDELYYFVGGQGQMLIDGEVIDVREGTIIRMSPAAVRAWRNISDQNLYFIVIQTRADSAVGGTITDGRLVDREVNWPK